MSTSGYTGRSTEGAENEENVLGLLDSLYDFIISRGLEEFHRGLEARENSVLAAGLLQQKAHKIFKALVR